MSRFVTCCALIFVFVNFCGCTELLDEKWIDKYECGDSKPYKKETCIKHHSNKSGNYSQAERFCGYGSRLVTIDSDEKQKFLEDFVKTLELKENFWIGLKYIKDDNTYQWPYGILMDYSNWKDGYPKNNSEYCVEFETSSSEFGKWSEKPCEEKRENVLCEELQHWDIQANQAKTMFLIKDKNKLQTTVNNLLNEKNQLAAKVKELEDNKVPVGFIYTQLPKDKAPTEIWPNYEWKDVSPEYAGVFFRVLGGNSSTFGDIQYQTTYRLEKVLTSCGIKTGNSNVEWADAYMSGVTETSEIITGKYNRECLMKFRMSSFETRPLNMAVKIWKRIK